MAKRAWQGAALVERRLVPLKQARVRLLDRGYLLGDGVFETLRARGTRILFESLHEVRMRRAVAALGLPRAAADAAFDAARTLLRATSRSQTGDLYVRVQVTSGPGEGLVDQPPRWAATAFARPFQPWPSRCYHQGVRLVLAPLRKDPEDPMAGVKSASFAFHVQARRFAVKRGADDALLLNTFGRACEASTSNLVAVRGSALYAPSTNEGAVDGVTRRIVLSLARRHGFLVRERLSLQDLGRADEAFLTNTIAGLVPIRAIRGVAGSFPASRGPVWRRLAQAYAQRVEAELAASPKPRRRSTWSASAARG